MLRVFVTLYFILLCSLSHAALPPAPLTISAAQEVVNKFRDYYEDDFKYDMSRVAKSPFPTQEQSYIYAKYMNKAFNKAGYSLDETLYEFFKTGGISGGTAGNPNVLFMQKLNLTQYAISLKSTGTANAFIKAEAVSERTIAYAKDVAIDFPVTNVDYLIKATPGYLVPGSEAYSRENGRFIGQVKMGTGPWKDWLYFEWEARRGEQYGIGLAQISSLDDDEAEVFKALNGKRVKVEGVYFIAKGQVIGEPNTKDIAIDPLLFDLSHKLMFKVL
ncbi:hypothetical protein [Pseudomonas sp. MYb193]|uniref:hypothetical protein n=1 Tax=Pseudomonas sp. MYb193 TaxID=1827300 RepID=UPI000CF6754D|nr:hypothetical protein [Pseudomonas sp. MYb193]AVJ24106.1 hypothetical protein CLM72_21225 [Pseudomonas sp. MYb193]